MTIEHARLILNQSDADYTQKQRVLRGLIILAQYDDNLDFAFEHDQIYVGSFEETVEHMTEEEVVMMRTLGWFESEESWSHY